VGNGVFTPGNCHSVNRGSSVSVVSGYRLDDQASEGQSPAEAKEFFL
jgi:hypothetical protein